MIQNVAFVIAMSAFPPLTGWHGKPIEPAEFKKRLEFKPVQLTGDKVEHVQSRLVWVPKSLLSKNCPGFQVLGSEYRAGNLRVILLQRKSLLGRDFSNDFSYFLGLGFFSEMDISKWSTVRTKVQPKGDKLNVVVIVDPDKTFNYGFKLWEEN